MDSDELPSTDVSLSGKYNINYNTIIYSLCTEKLKLSEKMSKAKTLEIEKLTRHKEGKF